VNGRGGAIQYQTREGVPVRLRFIDAGQPEEYGSTWATSADVDQHYSVYAQDRWSPLPRLSITGGIRWDHQDVSYTSSVRRPVITDGIFPPEMTVPGGNLVRRSNAAARIGFVYDVSGAQRTVLKAFYGRYYNNLADSFSSTHPGSDNFATYNFNDLNHNGKYDGPDELGALRSRVGGASATINPNLRTPFVEEWSGTVQHQFRGESSVRATFVRKDSRDFVPFYYSPYIPAWVGQLTVPTAVTVTGPSGARETYSVFDIPDALAGQSDALFDNIPDSDFHYMTIEIAATGRVRQRLFLQASADYQWRDELRTADIPNWGTNSPLDTDPIGVNFFVNANPAVPNRQQTTTYHAQALGRYELGHDAGVAVNFRYQSGYPYSRIIPDGSLPNLSPSPFFVGDLSLHRSDNVALLNFRIDKSVAVRKVKMTAILDVGNVLNANPVTNFNLLNDDFGHVIAVLDPRTVQVGFRVQF
jgi:hypothetical protein